MANAATIQRDIEAAAAAIADIERRRADIETEIATITGAPTASTDIDAEERAALKRLARLDALQRVDRALDVELNAKRGRLADLRENARDLEIERRRNVEEQARRTAHGAAWAAYQAAEAWADSASDLAALVPFAGQSAGGYLDALRVLLLQRGIADQVTGPAGVRVVRPE